MPTDDERREVAARLRGGYDVVSDAHGRFWLNGTLFGMDITARSEERIRDGLARLADLIEPSDRNGELCVHCDYCEYCDLPKCSDQDGYSFKPKGYVDLLELEDRIVRTARQDMEICGDTVPAWYAAGRLEAVARSIREILGVES